MKKVGKTTSPFRYELNQILYDYTVEVTNRFKRLDLKDRVPGKLWADTLYRRDCDQNHPQGKKMQKFKMVI